MLIYWVFDLWEKGDMMLAIRQLDRKQYPMGKQVFYNYISKKYYDIDIKVHQQGWHFLLMEKDLDQPFEKNLQEELFDAHKQDADVYVCEMDGEECGVIVLQKLEWNNTLLIHHLYVETQFKQQGIGTALLEFAKKRALDMKVRMIMLETQTSNFPAIQFYLKNDFQLIGFNLASYSNDDVKNREVRIEMGYVMASY